MATRKPTKTPKPRTRSRKASAKASGDEPVVDEPKAEATNTEPGEDEAQPAVVQDNEPDVKATEPDAPKVTEPEASANNDDARGDKAKADQPEGDARTITRVYKGATHTLETLPDGGGFRLDGDQVFRSITAATQAILGVSGGVSGPRWWGVTKSGSGRSRLSPEERAARDAEKARKAAEKAEAKAAKEREIEVAALDRVIDMLEAAAEVGRLTDEQVGRLKGLG